MRISSDTVAFEFEGLERLWLGRQALTVPLRSIRRVAYVERPLRLASGARRGLVVSGVAKIGVWGVFGGPRQLVYARRGLPGLHLRLDRSMVDGAFDEVVFATPDAARLAAAVERRRRHRHRHRGPGMSRAAVPVEVSGLTKRFGAVTAVRELSFTVRPGAITGFLGPNGAGKTTTMRMILGLVRPTSGTATIGGRRYRDLDRPSDIVGAVFDASAFHPGHTARDHLRTYAAMGGYPDGRVDELLRLLGLSDAAHRRTRTFSTGMRQRLNLATALLGDPSVLLLDEPGNGLDPEGVAWLRDFLRELAREGRTVLVSSHVLSEVQQLVDDVVVIRGGRRLVAGRLVDLVGASGSLEQLFLRLTSTAPDADGGDQQQAGPGTATGDRAETAEGIR
ncbi:ABC transporter ATP-binding protein [Plantactinospora mayteni]|nr:ATP-binding cassette domain-containing protein [Plantactinospora mayteni]